MIYISNDTQQLEDVSCIEINNIYITHLFFQLDSRSLAETMSSLHQRQFVHEEDWGVILCKMLIKNATQLSFDIKASTGRSRNGH